MKTLYFEGAGWSGADISKKTIGNCRIRTAFHLDDGRAVYLEIIGCERTKRQPKKIFRWKYTGFVDSCHYITDEVPNDDCNKHRVVLPGEDERGGLVNARIFEYTEEAILRYVNSLGASFKAVKVIPDLGGYRVFPEECSCEGLNGYYYGDEFRYDPKMTSRREAVHKWVWDMELTELKKDRKISRRCPNFSLWVDEKDSGMLHLLRHFNGYNRHWTIRTDTGETLEEWLATAKETPLGRCGC